MGDHDAPAPVRVLSWLDNPNHVLKGGVLDTLDCWVFERGHLITLGKVVKGVNILIREVAGEV